MLKKSILACGFALLLWAVVSAQDARTVIATASKAMGADTLNTIEYSGSGFDFVLGQAYSPTTPWPRFIDQTYTRAIDYRVPATRLARIRLQAENPPASSSRSCGSFQCTTPPTGGE